MIILSDIPFSLNRRALLTQLHIEPRSDDADDLQRLIDLATERGNPKAAYTVSYVEERDGDRLVIDTQSFTSRTLSKNLASVERLFPQIATCGAEMDDASPANGDVLHEFWWDAIKTQLLGAAHKHLCKHLNRKFHLGKTASMHPGSGDASIWPIEQQRALFALFGNVTEAIGVRLTDSCLMVPNKTTSEILFPTETDFRSCEVCHREGCSSRHALFNEALWESLQHE